MIRWGILGGLLAVAGTLSHPAQSDTRIAIVHFSEVVESSPEFAEASAKWSERLSALTTEIQALEDDFAASDERLSQSDPPLEGVARNELVASMERLRADIERRRSEVEPDLNALRESLLRPVVEHIRDVAEEVARRQGVDILIDSSSPTIGFVLTAREVDLTDAVIEALGGTVPEGGASVTPDAPAIPLLPDAPFSPGAGDRP